MDITCEKCNKVLQVGDFPFCPHDHQANSVIGDECDILVKHGLCNADGSPKRYRSKSEMARDAAAHGWTNYVRHIGAPGSDKSKHTSRWV